MEFCVLLAHIDLVLCAFTHMCCSMSTPKAKWDFLVSLVNPGGRKIQQHSNSSIGNCSVGSASLDTHTAEVETAMMVGDGAVVTSTYRPQGSAGCKGTGTGTGTGTGMAATATAGASPAQQQAGLSSQHLLSTGMDSAREGADSGQLPRSHSQPSQPPLIQLQIQLQPPPSTVAEAASFISIRSDTGTDPDLTTASLTPVGWSSRVDDGH
jgi:hypothetical protein